MSASSKKKLRREQNAAQLTERQLKEQKEAKNLKILTSVFVIVMVLSLVVALTVGIIKMVNRTGILDRNTVALTIGENELSSAELNYYYVDAIQNFYEQFYNNYQSNATVYAQLFYGIDFTKPLDDQIQNQETGDTWADYFIHQAIDSAKSVYTLCAEAEKSGFTLPEDQKTAADDAIENMTFYATMYGYTDVEEYLQTMYGFGSTEESFREYYTMNALAYAFQSDYYEKLAFSDDQIRDFDKKDPKAYNAYSYSVYNVAASKFYTGGTKDDKGNVTYSDAEKAAGLKEAEKAANALVKDITTLDELNAAIQAMPINKDIKNAAATTYNDQMYSSIADAMKEWICADARTEGDITVIPNVTKSTDEDGKTVETTNGYYVVMFHGVEDNTFTMPSVRHLLVKFEGGKTDSTTGTVTYTDKEKAAAKIEADVLMADWISGKANEDSFAELVKAKTDDTASKENGGLYEDIYPGQMVTAFNDWCFAEGRKAGDTGIVETNYGYHLMYYVDAGETAYRDYMIENDMKQEALDKWYEDLMKTATVTEGDTSRLNRDVVISSK